MTSLAKPITEEELAAGIMLVDPLLFRMYWFGDEFTLAPSVEQKLIFCDESRKVLLCTGRKIAKTVHLEAKVLQLGITNKPDVQTGMDEALFFTPGEAHLTPFIDRLYSRIQREPILAGVFHTRRGEAPVLDSATLRFYFRVEGLSGTDRNMVGLRAKYILGDEMAFGNNVCHNSRLQTALPDCEWIYAGVPNGVRGTPFYRLDQTREGKSWSKHKYSTFINPIYSSPNAQQELIDAYGGTDTQGYVTQVLGLWGDELLSSFPPGSIAVRIRPYFQKSISDISHKDQLENLPLIIGIPSVRCISYCIGVDYGYSPDPEEIVVAYKNTEEDEWQLYCRIELRRVSMPRQVDIINYITKKIMYGTLAGLGSDNVSLIQSLQSADPEREDRYLLAAPGGSTKVIIKEAGGVREAPMRNKEYFTFLLKSYMLNAVSGLFSTRLWLCDDAQMMNELTGTTEKKTDSGYTVYFGPSDPDGLGRGSQLDHIRDALTFLCFCISVANQTETNESSDELWESMGWVGESGWTPLTRTEN